MSWRPSAALSALRARAAFLAELRAWFHGAGYLEVEVPSLALAPASDPWLDSFEVCPPGAQSPRLYLLTSPEAYLKRLLARDRVPVFSLARAFRAEPRGPLHQPEFTLLEWYQPHADFSGACDELQRLSEDLGFGRPERCSYRQLFESVYQRNPHRLSEAEANALIRDHIDPHWSNGSLEMALNVLFSEGCEPLCENMLVTHFPASQAAMSRTLEQDGDLVCLRVEWYLRGVEIANGYDELVDGEEQRKRASADQQRRAVLGRPVVPVDAPLLSAVDAGLPPSYGVALGVDRLFCARMGFTQLADGVSFTDVTV
ncbi:MAG: hypothetical protein EBS77_06545 [Gammaproteobacteria bacterium]|nr:hypothetical protein [Gammaproteobacteria bacterium]